MVRVLKREYVLGQSQSFSRTGGALFSQILGLYQVLFLAVIDSGYAV